MLTFSTAVGAIAMKTTAAPILRRFGFKQVLVINAVVSAVFIGVPTLFTPIDAAWPDPRRAAGRRLLQVAAIHQHQYTRLCRHRTPGDERGDELCQRRAATIDVGRRRRRRARARDPASRTRGHGGRSRAISPPPSSWSALISAASAFVFMRMPKSAGASLSGPARPVGAAQEKRPTEARVDL